MKCTDCGREISPVVAVDIDGTLANYHGHFLNFSMNYLQHFPSVSKVYDGSELYRDWFCREFHIPVHQWYDIKLAYRQGGMKRSQPMYPGAPRFIRNIRSYGAEVWLTTTRPYLRLDNVDPDTRFWLKRNSIFFDGLLYDDDKYAVLAEKVDKERVVAIVDDLPEQYDAAAEIYGAHVPILRKTMYNRGVYRTNEIESLDTGLILIQKSVRAWMEAHT